jgi:aminopeptidase-like protein
MDLRVRRLSNLRGLVDAVSAGEEMLNLIRELFPICRSITGNGLRRSSKSRRVASALDA